MSFIILKLPMKFQIKIKIVSLLLSVCMTFKYVRMNN